MKHNGHLTFQCVIGYWGTHSNARMPGAIPSFNVLATRGLCSHNCATKSKLGILNSIRDQITKKQVNKETAKKL